MASRAEMVCYAVGALAAGALYIAIHERRRKQKKELKLRRDAPIAKELLLQILNKSAEASKAVIERIRVEVQKIQQQKNLSSEQAHQLFQQNFEHSLDQLIGAIRTQHKVSEKAMDSSFKQHQNDPAVRAAIQNMRVLSSTAAAPPAAAAAAAEDVPASLTRDKLREIMTFNAVTLEKELKPIREQMEKIRAQGQSPQVSPQVLQAVQQRISQAVNSKYGVTDEQVMAAVEKFGAREDPAFKDILQRIAQTFASSLS
ncbi:hypothetical protein AB1Y20_010973 [Prymnesium parvum]|uniref:Uncharacterized protein n=1 Tax=Prymnesium parvum TaxID=97485 RepID=A0AB34IP25_PRYPA|mmetsp:Transcript_11937/g.29555  ORF Transcript_11937/g.29555 Transcript_11937/m.29555 type:complete len:257 (-) Transcript_11937:448-1218(-)